MKNGTHYYLVRRVRVRVRVRVRFRVKVKVRVRVRVRVRIKVRIRVRDRVIRPHSKMVAGTLVHDLRSALFQPQPEAHSHALPLTSAHPSP